MVAALPNSADGARQLTVYDHCGGSAFGPEAASVLNIQTQSILSGFTPGSLMSTRYIPIDVFQNFSCTGMELYDLRHSYFGEGKVLTAYFSLAFGDDLLKVHFSDADIVRVQDELLLSIEEYGIEVRGLKPRHFAYRVENSRLFLSQTEFYRDLNRDAVHYRFVTGGACLDVLTTFEHVFALVRYFPRESEPGES